MADLPKDRVEPSPPFTYCGVNLFGLWYVKGTQTLWLAVHLYGLPSHPPRSLQYHGNRFIPERTAKIYL